MRAQTESLRYKILLFLPERRPFFREGAELFELPLDLFYIRAV